MNLSLFKSQRPPSTAADVTEVDVTPVMNMFIILIPFLVSMAIFTHLSIIEFSLPPNVGPGMNNSSEKPKPKLTVRIGKDYVGIVLGEQLLDSLRVEGELFPFDTLSVRLKMRKLEVENRDEVIVASRDDISFKHVVKIMDLCREAGFQKIGLSSATVDPGAGI